MTDPAEKLESAKAALRSPTPARRASEQELLFAHAYVELAGDGPAALKAAGYRMTTRESEGAMVRKLKSRPHVAQAIAEATTDPSLIRKHREALSPSHAPLVAGADEVRRFWTDVMRGTVKKDPAELRVMLRASENLARHLGILVEKNEQAPPVIVQGGDGGMRVAISFVDNGRAPPEALPESIDASAEEAA